MKCHYEVLNVSRDADEGEIKLAYKKLALKWHPDKNLDDIEHATEQFQLVQQAYEILSDRQERAWYDNHREQILRGSNSDFIDNNLDVFQYFTTTCFKGYGDDDGGFYAVYANIFEQIAKEDLEYMDDKEEFCNIPMFGNSTSDYEETVAAFYNFWASYSTKKSYVWLDPYSISEAKNRRVLKLIDKENDKIRQKARKERNEEVRSLVAFVRKRDKRVQTRVKLLEERKLENRRKQERLSKEKRLERIKQLNESTEQADWMKFENVRSELEEIEKKLAEEFGDDTSDSERSSVNDEGLNHLYCVACNKIFKNPKAFVNHESSKKHKENIDRLRESMIEDEELNVSEVTDEELSAGMDETFDDVPKGKSKSKKKKKKSKNVIYTNDQLVNITLADCSCVQSDEVGEDFSVKTDRKVKQKKKREKLPNSSYTTVINGGEDILQSDDRSKLKNRNERNELRKNKKVNALTDDIDKDHYCVICKAYFVSKNKLFDHLKKTGHSVFIPPESKAEKKKKTLVKDKQ